VPEIVTWSCRVPSLPDDLDAAASSGTPEREARG